MVTATIGLLLLAGVGRAGAQPTLTVAPLEVPANTPVTITVTGTPGHAWAVGGSAYNSGFVLNGVALALGSDADILGRGVFDATGSATFVVSPPPNGLNALYFLQAVTALDASFASPQVSPGVAVRPAGMFTDAPVFPQGLSAGGARITDVGAPSLPTDAVNKAYVDEAANGGDPGDPGGASGAAGGDLAGSYPNPTINPSAGPNIVAAINASGAAIADANLPATVARLAANNTFAGTSVFNGLATFAAGLSAGSGRVQNVGVPVMPNDAATKAYADSVGGGGPNVLRAGQLVSAATSTPLIRVEQTGSGLLMRLRTNSDAVPGAPGQTINMDAFLVASDGGWVSRAQLGSGLMPASGAGERTMWIPFKAAFRTGSVGPGRTDWDDPNVGFYSFGGGLNTRATSIYSFAFGSNVESSASGSAGFGVDNTVSGSVAFSAGADNAASGLASVVFGIDSRAAGRTAAAFGEHVSACADHSVALGFRASTSSAPTTTEPCSGTAHSGAFVFADASTEDIFATVADNEFAVRAAGGFRFRTNLAGTTGCNLPAGSGVFSCASDRDLKKDFSLLDGETVLKKVAALPVTSWRFLDEAPAIRHVGPMAQDFYAAFGLGDSDRMIGYTDINGINMRAIQALEARTRELHDAAERIRALEERLAQIEAQLKALLHR